MRQILAMKQYGYFKNRDVKFSLKMGQITTKWDKSGTIFIFKNPKFVLYGANLAQLKSESDMPVYEAECMIIVR